jgi:hypothetical protein
VSNPETVRIIPELNIAALNQHKDKELLFWYLLRALDVDGKAWLSYETVKHAFIYRFKYSTRTFDRHIKLGTGKLWNIHYNAIKDTHTIEIYGVKRAIQYLSTYGVTRHVNYNIETFLKYRRKAMLWEGGAYRCYIPPHFKIKKSPNGDPKITLKEKTNHAISRPSLKDKTGIPIRTQQRYDHTAEVSRVDSPVYGYDTKTHKTYVEHLVKDGVVTNIKKLNGNRYLNKGEKSAIGNLIKASRQAQLSDGLFNGEFKNEAGNKGLIPGRRFYDSYKDWVTAYTHGKAFGDNDFYLHRDGARYVRVAL